MCLKPTLSTVVIALLVTAWLIQPGSAADDAKVITMQKHAGYGTETGKIISEFHVLADGTFRFDGKRGRLTMEQIDDLRRMIAAAETGPPAEDAPIHKFVWSDGGKLHNKLFTNPTTRPLRAILAKLEEVTIAASQPAHTLTARIATTKEQFKAARQSLGDHGCLAIRSQTRWDEMQRRLAKLGWKPAERHALSNVNFRDDMIVMIYKCGDERDQFSVRDYNPMGMPAQLDVAMSYIIYKKRLEVVNRCNLIMMAVPRLRTLQVSVRTYHPFNGGKHPTAEKGKLEWQGLVGTQVSDHVDELNAKIKPKDARLKAGDDIRIQFDLHRSKAVKGKPGQFASQRTSLWVWDGKYSGGYRNHAFEVETPDGQTLRLRPKLQLEWDKNIPHPIEIQADKPYTLPNWREGEFLKSLQQLGLHTSKPGTYTITGIYEQQVSGNFWREDDPPSWGGTIASNTITVEVAE